MQTYQIYFLIDHICDRYSSVNQQVNENKNIQGGPEKMKRDTSHNMWMP